MYLCEGALHAMRSSVGSQVSPKLNFPDHKQKSVEAHVRDHKTHLGLDTKGKGSNIEEQEILGLSTALAGQDTSLHRHTSQSLPDIRCDCCRL